MSFVARLFFVCYLSSPKPTLACLIGKQYRFYQVYLGNASKVYISNRLACVLDRQAVSLLSSLFLEMSLNSTYQTHASVLDRQVVSLLSTLGDVSKFYISNKLACQTHASVFDRQAVSLLSSLFLEMFLNSTYQTGSPALGNASKVYISNKLAC